MKKPWEETWHHEPNAWHDSAAAEWVGQVECGEVPLPSGGVYTITLDDKEGRPGRLQLASAAPDLYRALAAVEWSGIFDGEACCPECAALESAHLGHDAKTHAAACTLAAALRKARGET